MRSRCPDCDQGDRALETYPDGNTFCHACRRVSRVKSLIEIKVEEKKKLELPTYEDRERAGWYPDAIEYLAKYYITTVQASELGIFWSHDYKRIVFPLYITDVKDRMIMIAAWMRSLDPSNPAKTLFVGDKNNKSWVVRKDILDRTDSLVIVEDVVSAIRVSKYYDCLFLGGTAVTDIHRTLMLKYHKLIIWLDGDKAGRDGAEKIRQQFKVLRPVRIIKTKEDPKCYSPTEMKEILK